MKRVIKNYTNIEAKHIALIAKAYPEGFGDEDLQVLSMPNGKYLRALEVTTEDTIYLFRIDDEMLEVLEDATDDGFELDVDAVATPGSGGKSGKPPVDLDEVDRDDDGDSDREEDSDDDDSDDDRDHDSEDDREDDDEED